MGSSNDAKWWSLSSKGVFTIKSFYGFLNDRGLRCYVTLTILKGVCPYKIYIFNWFVWDNKILMLKNLANRKYNIDY